MGVPEWDRIQELFDAALGVDAPARDAFLTAACGGDDALREEVRSLLAAHDQAGSFIRPLAPTLLEHPPAGADTMPPDATDAVAPIPMGTRFGSYEVVARLGAGGMGEVYRAHDSKLGRDVAIKILPRQFAADADRRGRLEREARLLATLNHPHIGGIYGIEDREGVLALVLELVEGDTLAERIARSRPDKPAIKVREALSMARQIADALEAAHDKGIVHRDLKPANIKVTPTGTVKVLDFGIAKVSVAADAPGGDLPAINAAGTGMGILIGTPAYMSPEQALGQNIDKRTDIWAFGCVLYEMLTGRGVFGGDTPSETTASVLERIPDWRALPEATPSGIRRLIQRCLDRDPSRRLHDIADARLELDDALASPAAEPLVVRAAPFRRVIPLAIAAMAGGAVIALLAWAYTRPSPRAPEPPSRFNIAVARGTELTRYGGNPSIALSRDGRHLIYAAEAGGLYIRSFDGVEAHLIAGTEAGWLPFLSPDGRWVGFAAGGKLQKVPVEGGSPRPIVDVTEPGPAGASWGEDGSIVYASGQGLYRVSAEGGTPQKLTDPDPQTGEGHGWPQILPGGRAVLYTIGKHAGVQEWRIAILSLDTGKQKVIVEGGTFGRYVPTGHLVYANGGTIFAAPFDIRQDELTGPAVPVLEDVRTNLLPGWGGAQFAFSHAGALAYITPHERPSETQLLWVDRKGSGMRISGAPHSFDNPSLSSDGKRLLVSSREPDGASNLWLCDRDRQTWTQLTFEKNNDNPAWSPRGDRFAFQSTREGRTNLWVMPADGGDATRLTTSTRGQRPTGWSPDGQVLLFEEQTLATNWDVWELPLGGDRHPRPLVVANGYQGRGRLSPDGRWLAYESDEVYVRPYRGSDRRWSISTQGGAHPVWSRTGREIYYMTGSGALGVPSAATSKVWVVPVTFAPTFRPGAPRVLFEREKLLLGFDVAPDGEHFVIVEAADAAPERLEIVIIPNWFEELKAKVPVPR